MARISRKEMKKDEFVETAVDFGQWIEENWKNVVRWSAVAVVVVLIVVAWFWWVERNREEAERLVSQATQRYQAAEAEGFSSPQELEEILALFREAIGRAGGAPQGQVARYYTGATLYRLGRLDEAIEILDECVEREQAESTLAGTTRALLANALVDVGQPDRAVALLTEYADRGNPEYPAEVILLRIAQIHREQGDLDQARRVWTSIVERFPQSGAAREANRLLSSQP